MLQVCCAVVVVVPLGILQHAEVSNSAYIHAYILFYVFCNVYYVLHTITD